MSKRFFQQLNGAAEPQQPAFNASQQQQNQEPSAEDEVVDLDEQEDVHQEDEHEIDPPEPAGGTPPEVPDALKAERRRTNQLERELRTLRSQLSQFSKINPDEYERLQEAERQKLQLETEVAHRERQLEAAATRKIRQATKERDDALQLVQDLRKERLLERLFLDAEGRPGGDNRGSFFDIFRMQVGSEFRLAKDSNSRDVLEPIDSKGNVILGDDGNVSAQDHVETLRSHPVLSFLFAQRGTGSHSIIAEFDGNGQPTNLQNMTASELYLATYARKPAGDRR